MADFTVLFDNYDLNLIPYLEFVRRYPNNEPPQELTTHSLVRRSGTILTNARRGEKVIPLEGFINAPSRTAYEQTLDTLKLKTEGIQRPLVISQSGADRRYIATKENLIDEHIEAGKSRVNIAFRCTDPYGKDNTLTSEQFTGVTSQPYALAHTFLGTASVAPTFTIIITSLTGGTTKNVGIGNSRTGQAVYVTRTWTNGDTLIINTDTKMCYVNGVSTDFVGVFPTFAPDRADAYYLDTLTTRTASVEVFYASQYL